jgi:hypothetical protein
VKPTRRFLAPGARAGNGYGHLTEPLRPIPETADEPHVIERIETRTNLCDEPEEIGPAIVDAYADLARTYDRLRHEAELEQLGRLRETLTLEQRLVEIQRKAKRQHVDISREAHALRAILERARIGGRAEPVSATIKIRAIEARLDHRPDLAA